MLLDVYFHIWNCRQVGRNVAWEPEPNKFTQCLLGVFVWGSGTVELK